MQWRAIADPIPSQSHLLLSRSHQQPTLSILSLESSTWANLDGGLGDRSGGDL
jgi:hypothetical protein